MKTFKNHWIFYILLTIIFIITYSYTFNEKLFLGGDNAAYYSLAKSIANGFNYIDYYSPTNLPANHFPPGLPFLMAIPIKLGVDSLVGLKVYMGLFLLGSVLLTYAISIRLLKNQIVSFLLAIAACWNMHLLEYGSITMSEVPYLFFLLLTFYCFMRFCDEQYPIKSINFVIMLIGTVAVVYIRTQGIAVLGAIIFYLVMKKQWKPILFLIGFFVVSYGPWQIRSSSLGGSSYV